MKCWWHILLFLLLTGILKYHRHLFSFFCSQCRFGKHVLIHLDVYVVTGVSHLKDRNWCNTIMSVTIFYVIREEPLGISCVDAVRSINQKVWDGITFHLCHPLAHEMSNVNV